MRSENPKPERWQIYSKSVDQRTGEVVEEYLDDCKPAYRRIRKPTGEEVEEIYEKGELRERRVVRGAVD
jgi:hypothetical protein